MKIPFWLYLIAGAILVWLGYATSKERQLRAARDRAVEAEQIAKDRGHEANRQAHTRRRIQIEAALAQERRRPVADRVRDSYLEYLKRRAGANVN